jgi:hypothetical protein
MRFSLCELSFALILTGASFLATARGIVGGVCVETREGIGVFTTVPARVDINYEKACCLDCKESSCYNYHSGDVRSTLSSRVTINFINTGAPVHLEGTRERIMQACRQLSCLIRPSLSKVCTILTNKCTQFPFNSL